MVGIIMSNLNDLMAFWGEDSSIAKRATKTNALPKYALPAVESEEGFNIFERIGTYIVKINQKKIEEDGFIELDKEWASSDDQNIDGFRKTEYDGSTLYGTFPKPFNGRKVYLAKISLESKQETTDAGVSTKKTIRGLKSVKEQNGVKRMMFSGSVCVFHNKTLGYNPSAVHDTVKTTNEKGEIVEVPDENGYQYRYLTFFTNYDLVVDKIAEYVKGKIEAKPEINYVTCFALTGFVKRGDLKNKDDPPTKPTAQDYWYSMNLDDIFMI